MTSGSESDNSMTSPTGRGLEAPWRDRELRVTLRTGELSRELTSMIVRFIPAKKKSVLNRTDSLEGAQIVADVVRMGDFTFVDTVQAELQMKM